MTDKDLIQALVNNMVLLATVNNRVIEAGGTNEEELQLAIQLNNNAITTFSNTEEDNDKIDTEDSNTTNDEIVSEADGDGNAEGVKVTRKGSL